MKNSKIQVVFEAHGKQIGIRVHNLKGECDEFVAYFCDNCGRLPKACKRCIKCGGKVIRDVAG